MRSIGQEGKSENRKWAKMHETTYSIDVKYSSYVSFLSIPRTSI